MRRPPAGHDDKEMHDLKSPRAEEIGVTHSDLSQVPVEEGDSELDDLAAELDQAAHKEQATLVGHGGSGLYKPPSGTEEDSGPTFCGVPMKWLSLLALTLQTSGQAILIKWSKTHTGSTPEVPYISSTAVFVVEVMKLATSLGLVFYDVGFAQGVLDLKQNFGKEPVELFQAAVPSLIYTIQNNLMFYSLEKLSAPVQQVIYQMKVITTAGIGVLLLGKKLTIHQWVACFVLAFGVMLVQWPRDSSTIGGSHGGSSADQLKGFIAVLCACLTSGFAGVWIQKMLQQTTASVWMRNVQLALFGSFMAMAVATLQDGKKIAEGGFFQGYNARVAAVITMTAMGGLLCAVMLKYAGATHGCFSTAMSIVLTNFLSKVMFNEYTSDMLALMGTIFVVGASLLFALGPPAWLSKVLGGAAAKT